MPAPYDYASASGYARTRADWVDFPSTSTPITQTQMDQFDQATKDLKSLTYNVKDYGAKGDSPTTDDTTAIQNALDACRTAGGGTVFIPDGTYKTTADLIIGSNTWLCGSGRGKAIIKRASTTSIVAVLKNYDRAAASADTDIVVSDLTIWRDGVATTGNDPFDNAVFLEGVTRASVLNCRIRGGGKGLHLYGCRGWDVTGNYFDTYNDNGLGVNPAGAANYYGDGRAIGNHFSVPTGAYPASGLLLCQSGVLVQGNSFVDQKTQAIEAAYNGQALSRVMIANNVMRYTGSGTVNNGILFGDQVNDSLIIGNLVEKGIIYVASGTPASTYCNRLTIQNNVVVNGSVLLTNLKTASVTGNIINGSGSLGIQSCQDVIVAENIVSNSTTHGISLQALGGAPFANKRIRLIHNTAFDNGTALGAGNRNGIFADAGDDISLIRNRCYDTGGGTQQYGLYVNATTNLIEDRNDFRGNATAERLAFTGSPTFLHMPTVASATALTVSSAARMAIITGTTTITSVTATYAGHELVLQFTGILTFTDGSNLKLAGNFVTTADDTITLVCDGTNWFEVCRSVN